MLKHYKHGASVLITSGIITVLIIIGFFAYQRYYIPKQETKNMIPETSNTETDSQSLDWEVYTDSDFGFQFYYPKSWELSIDNDAVTLTNFGPYYDDRIIITKEEGDQIKNRDSKFGDVTYYYDASIQSWMVDKNTDFDSGIQKAIPSFYTISYFPVFEGIKRWKTNIVSISANKFLVVNITGSGFTKVLNPFTETISQIDADISYETIANLIKTQTDSEQEE